MNKDNPIISIIMGVYSESLDWIKQSIDSILNQTYTNFEFIIVNDNPNRIENNNILEYYLARDKRIKIINNSKNLGLTKSLNIAFEASKGDFIARMDADDISEPQRLEKQVKLMNDNPKCDYCGTDAIVFSGDKIEGIRKSPIDNYYLANILFTSNPICHPSVMIRKSSIKEKKLYDEECLKSQDYELWLRFLIEGKEYLGISEPLLRYRISDQQISTRQVDVQAKFASLSKIKALKLYFKKIGYNVKNNHEVIISEVYQCLKQQRKLENLDKILIFYLCMSKKKKVTDSINLFYKSIFKYNLRIKHILILILSIFSSRWDGYNISKELLSICEE